MKLKYSDNLQKILISSVDVRGKRMAMNNLLKYGRRAVECPFESK